MSTHLRLAQGNELRNLPSGVIEEINIRAASTLIRLFFPRYLLKKRMKQRRSLASLRFANDSGFAERVKELIKPWAGEGATQASESLLRIAHRYSFEAGGVICYQGTPVIGYPIVVVLEGRVRCNEGPVSAPAMFNHLSFFEELPGTYTVVSTGITDCLLIEGETFRYWVESLDSSMQTTLYKMAFAARQRAFLRNSMDFSILGRSVMARSWPPEVQSAIVEKFRPISLHAHSTLLPNCDISRSLVYVASGQVGDGVAGSFLGELDIFLGKPWIHAPAQVASNTNLFVLSKQDIRRTLAKEAHWEKSAESFRKQLTDILSRSQDARAALEKVLEKTPVLPPLNDLANECKAMVFLPHDVICSTAEACDRMVIVIRGKARLRSEPPSHVHIGEPIGYLLLASHKWRYVVTADDVVEAFQLDKLSVVRYLTKKFGVTGLHHYTRIAAGVISPGSYELPGWVLDRRADLQTLPLHVEGQKLSGPAPPTPTKPTSLASPRARARRKIASGDTTTIPQRVTRSSTIALTHHHTKVSATINLSPSSPPLQGHRGSMRAGGSPSRTVTPQGARRAVTTFSLPDLDSAGIWKKADELYNSHKARVDTMWVRNKPLRPLVERIYHDFTRRHSYRRPSRASSFRSVDEMSIVNTPASIELPMGEFLEDDRIPSGRESGPLLAPESDL